MREYRNQIMQVNTTSPENMVTQSLPFLVLLKEKSEFFSTV